MDAASIEQMNKLRKSLGLPPLAVPGVSSSSADGPTFKPSKKSEDDDNTSDDDDNDDEPASTLETREAAGYENFKKIQDEEKKKIEREKRKAAIQKARDIAARNTRLTGKGLGDEEEGEQDAIAWLKGQKKRQKQIELDRARRREEEIAEQERLASLQYTSSDLAGVQVAHEIGDFDDGVGEQILTLQDQEIGDGEDDDEGDADVLENADLVAKDKLKDKLNLKKKIAYDVHDQDEKGLLAQYDDKKRKAFTLDARGGGLMSEERDAKRQQIGEKLKNTISLDILKTEPVSDYTEIKIRKPKKTKKKNKRQKEIDEDDIFPIETNNGSDEMELDGVVAPRTKVKTSEAVFNDDEDLATALGFSRRAALKKQKRKPEDIVKQLKEEEEDLPDAEPEQGLTLDDTTAFLDNLATKAPDEESPNVHKSIERDQTHDEQPSPDHEMSDVHAGVEDEEELLARLRREQSTHTPEVTQAGLDEEKSLDTGIGAALSLLKQRGLIKTAEQEAMDKNKLYRDRQKFIIEARLREHETDQKARQQRERDRASGKLAHMSAREREEHARWQNTQREHQSSIAAAAAFNKEYKPDVSIKYVDEDGRLMNQKEAFKHLSHQFHGKGSGKGKTEKHLKKLADEKRREARSVLDASSEANRGYEGAAQHQRRGGEAGVRLQ